MFGRKVSDLKWRVLAQLERENTPLAYSEAVSGQEKHHIFEGRTPFPDTTFCISTVYARRSWNRSVVPCARKKATHLIVRPHIQWEFPEHVLKENGGLPWLHEMFELHVRRFFTAYAGANTRSEKTTPFVGVEIVMSARDIMENPSAPIKLWDRAIASYLAKADRQDVQEAASSCGSLKTPLPTRDEGASRWANGVAFQRRPLRGAAYRWQGGAPCG